MNNELFNKISRRNSFGDQSIILVSVVMKGYGGAIITLDARGGNNRPAEITSNIINNILVVGKGRLGIDIKAIWAMLVDVRLHFLKRFT